VAKNRVNAANSPLDSVSHILTSFPRYVTEDAQPDSKVHSAPDQSSKEKSNDCVKLVFAASNGGHLGQAMRLRRDLGSAAIVVTTEESTLSYPGDSIATVPTLRNIRSWIRNSANSALLALRLRPEIVVSFGARDVAFFCLWSKLIGAKLILVESFARVRTPSRFLRALAPLANRILVQWPELRERVPASTLVRPIYSLRPPVSHPLHNVLVVVGTSRVGMDRLLRMVDEASPLSGSPLVTCQIGGSEYTPSRADWYRWKPAADFWGDISKADLIITHDGSNTIGLSLELAKPVVVVPRTAAELDYESNAELAIELSRRTWVGLATDVRELREAIVRVSDLSPMSDFQGPTIASCVADEIEKTRTRKLPGMASERSES